MSSTVKGMEPTKYESGVDYYNALSREQLPLKAVNAEELVLSMDKDITKFHELSVISFVTLYNELKTKQLTAKKESLQNARNMRDQQVSVKSQNAKKKSTNSSNQPTTKIVRSACIPETFKNCTSAGVKLSVATFLVSHVSDLLKRDFIHVVFLNHSKIRKVNDLIAVCNDSENIKKFCEFFKVSEANPADPIVGDLMDFLLEASNLTGWDYPAKIGLDLDLELFINRVQNYLCGKNERKVFLQNIDTYEPLIKKYIRDGVAEFKKNKKRAVIVKQFEENRVVAINNVINNIMKLQAESKKNAKTAQPFDDDTIYEFYEGEPNYSKHIEGRAVEVNGQLYYILQLHASLYDVVAHGNHVLFNYSWKDRLNSIPKPEESIDLVHIQLKQATGKELNALNATKDITVSFKDKSGMFSTKTVSLRKRTPSEK